MLGGERLRDLVLPSGDRRPAGETEAGEWVHVGRSRTDEEVWERLFQVSATTSFQVAVHLDRQSGRIRTFYTAASQDDKFPEIPSHIRRKVEAFKESIRASE